MAARKAAQHLSGSDAQVQCGSAVGRIRRTPGTDAVRFDPGIVGGEVAVPARIKLLKIAILLYGPSGAQSEGHRGGR
jgi:hypothetical protein